jgi:lipoprotein-anchoring transpeptidase ErfK/SrfK
MKGTACLSALALLLGLVTPADAGSKDTKRSGKALAAEAVNNAAFSPKAKVGRDLNPVILKAQVLLDRRRFSPGVIDARGGENFRKAVSAFARAHGLPSIGELTPELWTRLTEAVSEPVLVEYTITEADVNGPYVALPAKLEEQTKLDRLGYTSPEEMLSERFHMDPALLKALNSGKPLNQPGTSILIANVAGDQGKDSRTEGWQEKVTRIFVDKKLGELQAYSRDGRLVAVYPASIGSTETPSPSGTHKVQTIALNPTYTYKPEFQFAGVTADKPFTLKPGPNSPVGTVWIDLDAPSYGIHGIPEPGKVSKAASEGCVRLTNWDAEELARLVQKGTTVEFGP